jgi:Zn-dependent oligopeptidase
LAGLIWTETFVTEPLSREAGDQYRTAVLAYGSARDPWVMVEDVLGYRPTPEQVVDGLIRATFTK